MLLKNCTGIFYGCLTVLEMIWFIDVWLMTMFMSDYYWAHDMLTFWWQSHEIHLSSSWCRQLKSCWIFTFWFIDIRLMTMFMSDWYAYFLMTKSWDLFSFELMQTTEMLLNLCFALHGTSTNVQVHVELILRWGCHWLLYILMKSSLN